MKQIISSKNSISIAPICMEDEQYLYDLYEYPLSQENCHFVVQKMMHAESETIYGIYDKEELVGIFEFYHICEKQAEIGYRIRVSKRKRGYMKQALSDFCTSYNPYPKLYARVHRCNHASIAVLTYVGFTLYEESEHVLYYVYEKRR